MALLIGCGDKEVATEVTSIESTDQEVQLEETPATQVEDVVEENKEQVVEETATEEITTNVEGENND